MKRLALLVVVSVGLVGVGIGSAAAADMPLPPAAAPVPYLPVAPPFSWTGFYVGGNLGLGWSRGTFSDPLGNSLSLPNNAMLLGGGQAGFNFEYYGGFVIGVEADFDWFANSGSTTSNPVPLIDTFGNPTGSTASIGINNKWLTTVTGRLGYAFDRVLLYGKGGGAWVGSNNPTLTINNAPVAITTTTNNWGWTAGVGVEWAFLGNFSARIEYDYVGLNNPNFTIPRSAGGLPAGDQFIGNNRFIQLVNAGVNYRFGGW
jgi:outer membrane immunogenic protein